MNGYLDLMPRTLSQALDDTRAEIDRLYQSARSHQRALDRDAQRILLLEERAATLGEELILRQAQDEDAA